MLKNFLLFSLSLTAGIPNAAVAMYYPYGDEISLKISDHKMVAEDIIINGEKCTIASSNAWARGTLNGFQHEPAYQNRQEPDLVGRINENINRINTLFFNYPNTILALQEWNKQDNESLTKALPLNYDAHFIKTDGESFEHGIIYNKEKFKILSKSSSDILALNNLSWKTSDKSGTQSNRYLHLQLMQISTNQIIDVVCVHLKWLSTPKDIEVAFKTMGSQYPNLIIMGDFNSNLSGIQVPNITIEVSLNGSQSSVAKQAVLNTTDAIAYKFSPSLPQLQQAVPSNYSNSQPVNQYQVPQQDQDPEFLIKAHVSGRLQQKVRDLLKSGDITYHVLQQIVNETPNRSGDEFQKQIQHWGDYLDSLLKRPTESLIYSQQYVTQYQAPQQNLDSEALIKAYVSGQLQQRVRYLLNSGAISYDVLQQMAKDTPTRSGDEFQYQIQKWKGWLNNF